MNDPLLLAGGTGAMVLVLWMLLRPSRARRKAAGESSAVPRCPHCGEIVYNRRLTHCATCRSVLPAGIGLSDDQTQQLTNLDLACRKAAAENRARNTGSSADYGV